MDAQKAKFGFDLQKNICSVHFILLPLLVIFVSAIYCKVDAVWAVVEGVDSQATDTYPADGIMLAHLSNLNLGIIHLSLTLTLNMIGSSMIRLSIILFSIHQYGSIYEDYSFNQDLSLIISLI